MYESESIVGERGQITIPKKIRDMEGIKANDTVVIKLEDDKIIVEIKALKFIPTKLEQQIFKYLNSTSLEIGYLLNFVSSNLYFKRYILSNIYKKSARSE